MARCKLWDNRVQLALTKARKCLPPTIGKMITDRITDDVITSWLGEHTQRELLINEVLALPEPEEVTHDRDQDSSAVRE
jgi:hypothetical protein